MVEVQPLAMHEAFHPHLIAVQSEVRSAFGWSVSSDAEGVAAMVQCVHALSLGVPSWLPESRGKSLDLLRRKLLSAPKIVVIGAAVTQQEADAVATEDAVIIAADGAVGALTSLAKLACIVSDFDGGAYLDDAAKSGAAVVAHGHGDNILRSKEALHNWAESKTPPQLILTHQTPYPVDNAHNFGGFTDGDRAVCFALAMGVKKENIELVGFAMGVVGRWSATTVPEQKLQKLMWMKKILEFVEIDEAIRG